MKVRLCILFSFLTVSGQSLFGQDRLSLDQLVASALQHNGDILAVRQKQQEASGLVRQAGVRPSPSIQVEGSSGTILGSRGEYDFSVSYAHTFETGNKRSLRIAAAEPAVELARLESADRERTIRSEVAEAYADALAARLSLDTLEKLSTLNQEYLRVAQARVDQGESAPLERGLLQVEFSRIETDRLRLEAESSRALLVLKNLAGLKLDREITLDGDLTLQPIDLTAAGLIERALANRPDLKAATLDEESRNVDLQLARAEGIPNVTGFLGYSYKASHFDQLGLTASGATTPLVEHDNILNAGISIDLKKTNRNQGEIEAAIARKGASRYRREALTQTIERDVRSATSRYEAAQKTIGIFDKSLLSQSQQNLTAVRAAYEAGELRVFDLLSEQRRLVEIQRSYIDALKELYISRAQMERAAGGSVQ